MIRKLLGVILIGISSLLPASLVYADAGAPDWAKTLKNMGKVYSGDEQSAVDNIKVFGRVHGQWNYSDGESADDSFNGSGEELRRLRAGASVTFKNGLKVLGRMNLEEGGFGFTKLGFDSWDELYLEFGQKNWLGFDSASVGYGRYKLLFGGEEHQSSKRIKTIERSAINNRFGSRRPTGVKMNAEKDGVEYILGVWSTEPEDKGWASWDEGVAVQASAEFKALEGKWILDFVYADDADADETIFDYDWASSVTYHRNFGRINLMTNLTFSEAGDVDPLGVVILPTYEIVPNKWEAAFRYQWANSSADSGVPRSSSSRGIRRVARKEGLQTGAGEDYHAVYAGLNYYIAGDNVKLMSGLEYETISGDSARELDGVTFWLAARIYF
ncbi:MAG: porin [Pseudomonadota bacterium]